MEFFLCMITFSVILFQKIKFKEKNCTLIKLHILRIIISMLIIPIIKSLILTF